jgi:fatty-acyl-CoA synthase
MSDDLLPVPWRSRTLAEVLERAAIRWPNQEALVTPDRRLTYAELADEVARTATALRSLGVGRDDHVALCMGNTAEWVTLFYAAATIGAVTVPVNTRFKPDELRYCLLQADVATLLTVDRFLDKIDFVAMLRAIEPAVDEQLPGAALPRLRHVVVLGDDVPRGALSFRSLGANAPTFVGADRAQRARVLWARSAPTENISPFDTLLIQYTSGTTSFPKGVMLSHDNMLRNAAHVARRIGVRPDDRYFNCRPFFHVAGTTLSLLVALSAGACLVTLPTFDAGASLAMMERERCTLVSGNDTLMLMLLSHPDVDRSRLSLRGGWAAAGPEVMRQVIERMGATTLCYAYGQSEASPNVVMSDWRDDQELRVAGLAHPHDGVEVRTVDPDTGRDRPPGVPGEILVRGWNVMQGYYNQPDATAHAIDPDGWLRTGDLGEMTRDGRLRFVGRLKEMLRVGGENVAPADVEEVLHTHPAVRKAEVIGVPDARLGEVVAAWVQLREGCGAEPDELIAWCRQRCANFKVPRHLWIVDDFEQLGMTGSGKVQKRFLREHALRELGIADTGYHGDS